MHCPAVSKTGYFSTQKINDIPLDKPFFRTEMIFTTPQSRVHTQYTRYVFCYTIPTMKRILGTRIKSLIDAALI